MAAVMRAMSASMGVGKTSSSIGGGGLHSPSASGDGYVTDDSLFYRTRLVPPNPAVTVGSPTGILLNANRLYDSGCSAASSSASVNLPRNGSTTMLRAATPTSPNQSHPSPTHSPEPSDQGHSDRGRTLSRDSIDNGGSFPGNRKIRFAPLPEARPRRYSTGRNIWMDAEDMTDGLRPSEEDNGGRREFIRDHKGEYTGSATLGGSAIDDDDEDEDLSDDDLESPSRGIFGSWKSDSPSFAKNKENDESYTSKLLQPLKFGLGKKKKQKRPSSSDGTSLPNDSYLSRVESNDSQLTRTSSGPSIRSASSMGRSPSGSTGIPMRKTRTWEAGDTQSGSRRANYPPVAQRSKSRGRSSISTMSISAPDPSFVEWGFSRGGVGAVSNEKPLGTVGKGVEDDEDGSGMAWVKRRKAEKEAAAKKKAEEDAAASKAAEESSTTAETEGESASPAEEIKDGVRRQPPSAINTSLFPQLTLTVTDASPSSPTPVKGGLSSTRPTLQVLTDSTEPPQPQNSSDSLSFPLSASTGHSTPLSSVSPSSSPTRSISNSDEEQLSQSKLTAGTSSGKSTPRGGLAPPLSYSTQQGSDVEEDESDEDSDNHDSDDDDDLDAEELAEEEALAAKARATAMSAGAERYHDAKHHSRLLKVEGKAAL